MIYDGSVSHSPLNQSHSFHLQSPNGWKSPNYLGGGTPVLSFSPIYDSAATGKNTSPVYKI